MSSPVEDSNDVISIPRSDGARYSLTDIYHKPNKTSSEKFTPKAVSKSDLRAKRHSLTSLNIFNRPSSYKNSDIISESSKPDPNRQLRFSASSLQESQQFPGNLINLKRR